MSRLKCSPEEWFWKNVSPEPMTGCWLWMGRCDRDGYGRLYFKGAEKCATHVALALHGVVVNKGEFACHTCDLAVCVNPQHLFVGDAKTNMYDRHRKGRHAKSVRRYKVLSQPPQSGIRDLTGRRFGKLVIVEFAGNRSGGNQWWFAQCDCGGTRTVAKINLYRDARCCGCTRKDQSNVSVIPELPRGERKWFVAQYGSLRNRCLNPRHGDWSLYGGRGIECRFKSARELFKALGGSRPSPLHSIDRIDVNGHYEHGNVRWADKKTQSLNRRSRGTPRTTAKYKGVSLTHGRYQALISDRGKNHTIGVYDREIDAALAYDRAAPIFQGEYAEQNFPGFVGPLLDRRPHHVIGGSGYRGVSRHLNGRWIARLMVKNRTTHRLAATADEAARLYDEMLLKRGGDLSKRNFPDRAGL